MSVTHRWSRVVAGAAVSAALIGPAVALIPAVAGAEPCPPDVQECVQDPVAPIEVPQPDQPAADTAPWLIEEAPAPGGPADVEQPGAFNETGNPDETVPGAAGRPVAPSWAPDADVVWNPDMSQWGVWLGSIFVPVF